MADHDVWRDSERALRQSTPFRALATGGGEVVRLPIPAAAWIFDLLAHELERPLLVVLPHESDAYAWIEASRSVGSKPSSAAYFPAPSLSPYHEAEISLLVRAEEILAVDRVMTGETSTVVTTPRALFRRLPPPAVLDAAVRELRIDEEHPIEELVEHLVRWGYHRSDLVFEVGQFAVRGGVFDLFPPGEALPLRLDLFGDTIDSIHRFEPESQRSQDSVEQARIRPLSLFPQGAEEARRLAESLAALVGPGAGEEVIDRLTALREEGGFEGWQHLLPTLAEETQGLDQLLPDALVVAVDPSALTDEAEHHAERLASEHAERAAQRRLAVPPEILERSLDDVLSVLDSAAIRLGDLFVGREQAIDFAAGLTEMLHDQLPRLPREVESAKARGDRVFLLSPAEHRPRMAELLETQEIPLGRDGVELVVGDLQRGFRLPAAGLTVLSERQLLRRGPVLRRRPSQRKRYGVFLSSLRDLKIGDYVVHSDHGIGQFVGLRTLGEASGPTLDLPPELAGTAPEAREGVEVMEITYSAGKSLLLPLSRLDQIQKYSGIEGVAPRLDRLGGSSWNRTKRRIKKGMRDMAAELLKLYAERQIAEAPRMDPEGELFDEFQAAFEFDPTPDQVEAVEAILEDLQKPQPMDRLLCGDVGFGKTEVAMRAAFRVVESGYQVAVLAPTTILADQHLETFQKRFRGFPVTIDMVSRFRTAGEVKDIQKRAEQGQIDILIGTHRLLGRKMAFERLGLVIIDEEQRFGVAHKEKLKQLRKDVHVLAMSATPVPRTLQLSLAGVRDLSLIETPPRDRMAVETAILPFDPSFIREAVEFELERKGQIYFVHNRVESIDNMAAYLKEIVPGLRVTVGHGQLDERELSRRMHAFVDRQYDLLLATTIIENGIDIPNVNTMIVHRADRFGLSQLYQLRGRVGRSDQLAYCYLLVPSDRILSAEARKRLDAIREFTELGAGFRVAGRDLEIRGAGNLLGAEQSGHIAAVGIETYLKMLEEAVAEMRGEKVEEAPSVALDLPVGMSIPEDYIGDPNLRMEIYHRLAGGDEPREQLLAELRDRFGPTPDGVRTLIDVSALKRRAEALRLQAISARNRKLVLRLRQDARIEPDRLIEFVSRHGGAKFSPSGALTVQDVAGDQAVVIASQVLDFLAADPERTTPPHPAAEENAV